MYILIYIYIYIYNTSFNVISQDEWYITQLKTTMNVATPPALDWARPLLHQAYVSLSLSLCIYIYIYIWMYMYMYSIIIRQVCPCTGDLLFPLEGVRKATIIISVINIFVITCTYVYIYIYIYIHMYYP